MELVDLYDEDRRRTGAIAERHGPRKPGTFRTVVHVCLFDSAGRLLIQQRTDSKLLWPGRWDVTVGGGVDAGETSRQAAEREVREELGLELDLRGLRPALTVNFAAGFDDFFLVRGEADPDALTLQTEEVQRVRWATLPEVQSEIKSGGFIPYPRHFLPLLWELAGRPDGAFS